MQSFWSTLSKPFTVLAPMDDVTDVVFREMVRTTARPDVFFTEFTNVEALCSEGRESQTKRLTFNAGQKPTVAQIW
ncbi:MAG TPA: tRNA-dihydrouridine synthase, partial [Patescibacteria group bacterium]|nr:tRNA-dihydrouridine synthase [Patescibacteria group bacterium]